MSLVRLFLPVSRSESEHSRRRGSHYLPKTAREASLSLTQRIPILKHRARLATSGGGLPVLIPRMLCAFSPGCFSTFAAPALVPGFSCFCFLNVGRTSCLFPFCTLCPFRFFLFVCVHLCVTCTRFLRKPRQIPRSWSYRKPRVS